MEPFSLYRTPSSTTTQLVTGGLHLAAQAHMIAMLHGLAMLTLVMCLDCVPTLLPQEIFSNLGTRLA
jgi:hypothetical protein